MNWRLALDGLQEALSQTFAALNPEQTEARAEITRRFDALTYILQTSLTDAETYPLVVEAVQRPLAAAGDWEAALVVLRERLLGDFPAIAKDHPKVDKDVREKFALLLKEFRTVARKYTGLSWPSIARPWDDLSALTQRMIYEGQIQLGQADIATIFYFSSEAKLENLHWLKKIRLNPPKNRPPAFDSVLERALLEVRFGLHLQTMLGAPPYRRQRECKFMTNWARQQQWQAIATLTAGLPSLLDASHAEELIANLQEDRRAREDCIPGTLAFWFGEESISLFKYFIATTVDPSVKSRCAQALGTIGGPEATGVLCELVSEPSVGDIALAALEELASMPSAAVRSQDDPPDSHIEDTVGLVLSHLTLLKQSGTIAMERICEVERRVRAFHGLPDDDVTLETEPVLIEYARALIETERFLNDSGASTIRTGRTTLAMSVAQGILESYSPVPVLVATGQVSEQDVKDLVANSRRGSEPLSVGILIYQEPPGVIARLEIARARLKHGIAVIPIPLAEIERARGELATAAKLKEYAGRYLPGADMFDDRNAISDTLTFFGRSDLLNRIQKELLRVQSIGLFGLRKSGKTSMLLQLGLSLKQHASLLVDLQKYQAKARYGGQLFEEILLNLASKPEIAKSVPARILDPFPKNIPAGELGPEFSSRYSELVEMLVRAGYQIPVVCALDEVERIVPSPLHDRESVEEFNSFFGALRALSQQSRTVVLIATDVHPDFNRINQWPHDGTATNPVYNFFKEIYLTPFDEEGTKSLIDGIGCLMGLQFEEDVVKSIHKASGGHPYISRQLASLVSKTGNEDPGPIQLSAAARYLDHPFIYSGLLKNYFDENVWGDLMKRKFDSAMTVLRVLTASPHEGEGITSQSLEQHFGSSFGKNQLLEALLWLVDVGLVYRRWQGKQEAYEMRVPLLSRWIEMV